MATRKRCAKRILAMVLTAAVTMSTVITDSNITAYATTEAEVESNSQDAENTVESDPVTDEQGGSEDTTDNSTPSESTEGTDNPSGTAEDSKTDQPDAGESKDTSSDTSTDGSTDTESSSTDAGEESKDETENKDTDSADAAEGEEKPEGEEVTEENPDALLNPEEEVTEEEIGEAEVYANYFFGDPAYNENYIYDYDENDDPIYEMYSQDLDEIIGMAEEGMSLEHFFNGTLFANMTLDALHEMQDDSYSFDDLVNAYSFGIGDVPNSIMKYVGDGASPISLYSERDGGGSLTSTGVRHLSAGALGQQSVLGKDKVHGPVVKLQAAADGMTYDAFCATYGGSYRSGYTYTSVDWSELKTPGGASLTQEQYDVIQFLVAVFMKTTNQSDADYAGCQTAIWYVINNPNNIGNFYWDGIGVNGDGPMMPAIRAIASGNAAVQSGIISFIRTAHICYTLVSDITDFSPVGIDYYPGQAPELTFWRTGQNNFQWIITWEMGAGITIPLTGIPVVNNYYLEKEAVTRYNVDITKESVITNELLEGVQFRVDETDAGEHDINYTFK